MSGDMVDAREAWREAAVTHLQGNDIVTRFQQAYTATDYNLDCLVEKYSNLRSIHRDDTDSVEDSFFYVMMNTDEFFRHLFSVRENVVQEINFVFGPRLDWQEQGLGFRHQVREHLGEPDWWDVVDLTGAEWWDRAKEFRHHFAHRHIPTYMNLRGGMAMDEENPSADAFLTLLDPDGDTTHVPLMDNLSNLRSEMWDYCEEVAHVLATELED